jgi:hypothetical protein
MPRVAAILPSLLAGGVQTLDDRTVRVESARGLVKVKRIASPEMSRRPRQGFPAAEFKL